MRPTISIIVELPQMHNLVDRSGIGLEVSDQLLVMTALLERRKGCDEGRPAPGMAQNRLCVPARPLCRKVALLWPHLVQRAHCRSRSLDVSAPHRIMSDTRAIGASRW